MPIASVPIRQLLQRVVQGEVRIPAFQREFVWEPDRVQFLMDSIYKGYPIGSLLFWRTREQLDFDRELGPYRLPLPKDQYPIDYVLDGQQRLTSIFGVFQTDLKPMDPPPIDWVDIYFDMDAEADAQDSQFLALRADKVDEHRHFPLRALFDVGVYGARVRQLDDHRAAVIDDLQNRFKDAQIPIETIETNDHSKIAIVFERVNRGGVPLDTYQLLAAWTWSNEFDLRSRFDDLATELDDGGFSDLGSDPDLLLKCASSVISHDASARAVIALKGIDVRNQFDSLVTGIKGAIDFLSSSCGVASLKVLPYRSMLIPLVAFFSTDRDAGIHPNAYQREALRAWFWQSCFSRRYSNSVDNALAEDISAMVKLRHENDASLFKFLDLRVDPEFFLSNVFSLSAVNTKTFILLLATAQPKSFLSGALVDLEKVLVSCNRTEFHHIFPKSHLAKNCGVLTKDQQFRLANFAFLSQTDNRRIKDRDPAAYVADIPLQIREDVLRRAFISPPTLMRGYDQFCEARAARLAGAASDLCVWRPPVDPEVEDPAA